MTTTKDNFKKAGNLIGSAANRMSDNELDQVAGGYTYGKITIKKVNGMYVYTLHNRNLNVTETYVGKTDKDVMRQLVKHNYDNKQWFIVFTDQNKDIKNIFDVKQLAEDFGIIPKKSKPAA